MPRIPYFDLTQASPELKKALGKNPPLNVMRMIAHGGPSARGFLSLGGALLSKNALDSKLRELVIIRVGILCGSDYEVHQHKRLARRIGVPDNKIEALHQGPDAPVFDEFERKVLVYTDAVVRDVKADESTFKAVAEQLSHQEMMELTLAIGFYMLVSRVLENFEVEIEDEMGPG